MHCRAPWSSYVGDHDQVTPWSLRLSVRGPQNTYILGLPNLHCKHCLCLRRCWNVQTTTSQIWRNVCVCVTDCGIGGINQLRRQQRHYGSPKESSVNPHHFVWSISPAAATTTVASVRLQPRTTVTAQDDGQRRNADRLRQSTQGRARTWRTGQACSAANSVECEGFLSHFLCFLVWSWMTLNKHSRSQRISENFYLIMSLINYS